MQKIEKKIYPQYFQEIIDNRKTFEVRVNDFEINEGDTLLLREWNPETKEYTGREIEKEVGLVRKWKIEELEKICTKEYLEEKGIQIISLK